MWISALKETSWIRIRTEDAERKDKNRIIFERKSAHFLLFEFILSKSPIHKEPYANPWSGSTRRLMRIHDPDPQGDLWVMRIHDPDPQGESCESMIRIHKETHANPGSRSAIQRMRIHITAICLPMLTKGEATNKTNLDVNLPPQEGKKSLMQLSPRQSSLSSRNNFTTCTSEQGWF